MQNLSVISVNIWDILISLCNLMILTWAVKKFLFKRVQKVMADRKAAIDADYAQAKEAREQAEEDRKNYAAAMAAADQTANQIIAEAGRAAEHRGNEIVAEARDKANDIRRQAEEDAQLAEEFRQHRTPKEMSEIHHRTRGAILKRLQKLKLI